MDPLKVMTPICWFGFLRAAKLRAAALAAVDGAPCMLSDASMAMIVP
jgi:hypothetical protein